MLVADRTLPQIAALSVAEAMSALQRSSTSTGWRGEIAARIVKEVGDRLRFLVDVGLDYLTLDRSAETLSGGEAQRIRLASQIGSGLTGVMYILDEPSIGLHQRDNQRLLAHAAAPARPRQHRDRRRARRGGDPGRRPRGRPRPRRRRARRRGRRRRHAADRSAAARSSLTGAYLSGRETIALPARRQPRDAKREIRIEGAAREQPEERLGRIPARPDDLRHRRVRLGQVDAGQRHAVSPRHRCTWDSSATNRRRSTSVDGLEHIDRVIDIDQSPIGRTPRSNPATYTGLFAPLRELFAQVPEARSRGYEAGRFSFNVKGGRCEACQGDGVIHVEMHFLPDVYVPCDVCKGQRYNRETLEIRYRGKNIHEVLEMTIEDALRVLPAVPLIARSCRR